MIRFGCFASSKFGGIRSLLLPKRKFCEKISGQNSFDSTIINEIKQSLHKLESEIEQQNKFSNRQSEQKLEEIVANFDELKKNYGKFERKFASSLKEIEEGKKEMKEAFDKFEGNLQIKWKNEDENEKQEPGMEEAKTAIFADKQLGGNVNLLAMKNNTWNSGDCGPELTIYGGGLEVKHSGPFGINIVRAALPIPKFNLNGKSIIGYFEVEILKIADGVFCLVHLGFCSKQFPLVGKRLGKEENSIGILDKHKMIIEGSKVEFEECDNVNEDFNKGDVMGLGMINSPANSSPLKCFATCNGKLLGMTELPKKFAQLQLFPAVSFFWSGVAIKANFGANEWRFNPQQLLE